MSEFLWSVGGFFLILTPIILVHEYGHFIAARLSNIRVEEFGLGFPPRAMTLFERKGTIFSLNWIPLGGFVRPAGEDDPDVEGGLANASKRARFFVLSAGALANFIMAFLLFTVMYTLSRPVMDIVISEVMPNTPAEQSELQEGDVLLGINEMEIGEDFTVLVEEVRAQAGNEVTLLVERNGRELEIPVTPRRPGTYDASQEGAIGIGMSSEETGATTSMPLGEAMGAAVGSIWELMYSVIALPIQLFREEIQPEEARLVSVVGISQIAGQATRNSVTEGRALDVLWIMGAISVALGFTNLLPIPALDGGRIMFVLLEAVRGRRIEPEREGMVHAIGMALLLGLMVILIVQDIVNPLDLPS